MSFSRARTLKFISGFIIPIVSYLPPSYCKCIKDKAIAKRVEKSDKFIYFSGRGWAERKTELEEGDQENSIRSKRGKVRCFKV